MHLEQFKKNIMDLVDQKKIEEIVHFVYSNLNPKIILDAFIDALADQSYRANSGGPFTLTFIPIIVSSNFEVNINLFPPSQEPNMASSLIHNHGPFILYSKHLHGSGYKHGFFNPAFKLSNLILVTHDHTNNNEYKINDFEFHAVFGCRTLSATVAIWFEKESDQNTEPRRSLLIKDRKVFTFFDNEVDELANVIGATEDWMLIRFKLLMEFFEDYASLNKSDFYRLLEPYSDLCKIHNQLISKETQKVKPVFPILKNISADMNIQLLSKIKFEKRFISSKSKLTI
jgi:hypothetical protein